MAFHFLRLFSLQQFEASFLHMCVCMQCVCVRWVCDCIYLVHSSIDQTKNKLCPRLFLSISISLLFSLSLTIFRFFRVIPAEQYLAEFSSDRRHMRRPDGTWIKPPPPYPPIQSSGKLKMQTIAQIYAWQVAASRERSIYTI